MKINSSFKSLIVALLAIIFGSSLNLFNALAKDSGFNGQAAIVNDAIITNHEVDLYREGKIYRGLNPKLGIKTLSRKEALEELIDIQLELQILRLTLGEKRFNAYTEELFEGYLRAIKTTRSDFKKSLVRELNLDGDYLINNTKEGLLLQRARQERYGAKHFNFSAEEIAKTKTMLENNVRPSIKLYNIKSQRFTYLDFGQKQDKELDRAPSNAVNDGNSTTDGISEVRADLEYLENPAIKTKAAAKPIHAYLERLKQLKPKIKKFICQTGRYIKMTTACIKSCVDNLVAKINSLVFPEAKAAEAEATRFASEAELLAHLNKIYQKPKAIKELVALHREVEMEEDILNEVPLHQLPDAFIEAIKALRPGQVARPIKTGNGIYLLTVLDIKSRQLSAEEVGGISLSDEEVKAFLTYVKWHELSCKRAQEELRPSAFIKRFDD